MKVIDNRVVYSKRKFTTEEHKEGYHRNPVYQFSELEKIVRAWHANKEQAQ